MQDSTSEWIHIRKAKHTPNSTVLMVFKNMCTLDLKLGGAAKCSKCAKIRGLCTGNKVFLTKIWLVQNVHNSISCTVVSMKHVQSSYSYTIASPFVHHTSLAEKKPNTLIHDLFSVLSVRVSRTRPTKICISVSQQYSKLRIVLK